MTASRQHPRPALGLCALTLVFSLPGFAQEGPLPANQFAGFETIVLPNGLKVWYKRLPDDPAVSVGVVVPYGRDQDPPGKEQLHHFTEHMLFSDHLGRGEQEIKREIESLGGVYNGFTGNDRTYYWVHIGKEHGLFALDWLYRLVSPHAMEPGVVEKQREPVALEVRAQPRELFDWVRAYYLNPPWSRLPGFWEREFGLQTWESRDYYPYRSLYRISSADLKWLYETYYVPSRMTLLVVGDLPRELVLAHAQKSFGTLPGRPAPAVPYALRDPGRYRQAFYWAFRPNHLYSHTFKFYGPKAEDNLMLIFLEKFLRKRLNDKLRFGERKATYGIGVWVERRGPATRFNIYGGIKETELAYAREVIQSELRALRDRTLSNEEFEADRAAITRQLRVENSSAKELGWWLWERFYDPDVFRDFPDVPLFFDRVSQAEVEAFVRHHFVSEREVLNINFRHPLTQGTVFAASLLLLGLGVRAARRLLLRPIEMTRLHYVARLQSPLLYKLLARGAMLILLAVGLRLLVHLYLRLADRFLVGVENFWVQWSVYALLLVTLPFLLVLALARVPRKLLLFDDHLRIKYLSYRSVRWNASDIAEASLQRFPAVWLSRRLWKCVPLTVGVFSPGIYLRRRNGWAYFFGARNRDELLGLLQALAASASPP